MAQNCYYYRGYGDARRRKGYRLAMPETGYHGGCCICYSDQRRKKFYRLERYFYYLTLNKIFVILDLVRKLLCWWEGSPWGGSNGFLPVSSCTWTKGGGSYAWFLPGWVPRNWTKESWSVFDTLFNSKKSRFYILRFLHQSSIISIID